MYHSPKKHKKHTSGFSPLFRPRWKDNIPGFEGYYVSKRGRVFTRRRVGMGRKSKKGMGTLNILGYWKELTQVKNNKGYFRTVLRKGNSRVYTQVSRLVAMAWVDNPENKPFVCHKDNNPINNYYKNLYWGTQSENIQQMVKDGRSRWNHDII